MRRILSLVVFMLVAWCLVIPGKSRADVIDRFYGINLINSGLSVIPVTPFDPTLGTLNEVRVSISETVTFAGLVPPFTNYSLTVDQVFFGLAGKYFNFLSPIEFLLSGASGPSEVPVGFGTIVSLDFEFNAVSDLIGQAIITTSPGSAAPAILLFPTAISGNRSDFLKSVVPIDEVEFQQNLTISNISSFSFEAGGTMEIVYDYTPNPVPEPATMLLLGSGLIGLAGYGRKKFFKK